MKTKKRLGIWMDHSTARIAESKAGEMTTDVVVSGYTRETIQMWGDSEPHMFHSKQHMLSNYYKKLADRMKGYDEVVLFGPSTAKEELLNQLKSDHHFDNLNIKTQDAGKMTDRELHAFIREYFQHKH